jgi:glucokinase
MDTYIALDIGGTYIRAAVYPHLGIQPICQKKITTHGKGSAIERTCDLIADMWPDAGKVKAIGAGAPGAVDSKNGIVYSAPNIPGWKNVPFRQVLTDRFQVPVVIGNDANMATLGEWKLGAGQGHHNLIYLTISTGVGGGVIIEDHLLLGEHGLATEMGHFTVLPGGPLCGCGQRGHLEALSSGTAIARYIQEQIQAGVPSLLSENPSISSRDAAEAAAKGDELAVAAFARAGTFLGQALADYLHVFNPSLVIFGGGVTLSGDLLFTPLHASLERHIISPQYLVDLEFKTAALGDDAGLLGTLTLARMTS